MKTLWKMWLKLYYILLAFFIVLDLALFVIILFQGKFDVEEAKTLFTLWLLAFTFAEIVLLCPILIQIILLWVYSSFAPQLILKIFHWVGAIDYNVAWSLPKWINNLIGISIGGKAIDFIFWSGFIFSAFFVIIRIEKWLLSFLAGKVKIDWAKEPLEAKLKNILKNIKKKDEIHK